MLTLIFAFALGFGRLAGINSSGLLFKIFYPSFPGIKDSILSRSIWQLF